MAATVYSVILESNHAYICHSYDEAKALLLRFDQTSRASVAIKPHVNRDEADVYLHRLGCQIVLFERIIHSARSSAPRALTPLQRALADSGELSALTTETSEDVSVPSSLLLEVNVKFPRFGMTLRDAHRQKYASVSDLIVRSAWRQVRVRRIQQACVLIEALETDLGRMATVVASPGRDLTACLNRFVYTWRKNRGRNSRNQEVVGFALIDRLRTLIDDRKLSLFLHYEQRDEEASERVAAVMDVMDVEEEEEEEEDDDEDQEEKQA
jgi:hypothetical protein